MKSFHRLVLDFCKAEAVNTTNEKWIVEETRNGYSLISRGGFLSFWIGKGMPQPSAHEDLYQVVALALGLTALSPFIKQELAKAKQLFEPQGYLVGERWRKPRYVITMKGIRCSAHQWAPQGQIEVPELNATIETGGYWKQYSTTYTWEELRP